MDPRRIIVTDLDADYRVHPQYFAYLSWVHLTDPTPEEDRTRDRTEPWQSRR